MLLPAELFIGLSLQEGAPLPEHIAGPGCMHLNPTTFPITSQHAMGTCTHPTSSPHFHSLAELIVTLEVFAATSVRMLLNSISSCSPLHCSNGFEKFLPDQLWMPVNAFAQLRRQIHADVLTL